MNNPYYQKLLDIVAFIEEKRKLGWLLMSNNEQINSKIVFNTPFLIAYLIKKVFDN